jgi:uncharacterized protein YebE (UPF0316 family)
VIPFAAEFTASPSLIAFIFFAEMTVVTLSTLRVIFIARGMKYSASCLGFFEVSIWLYAIGQVMTNLSDLRCALAFAGGFTMGNFLGMLIEQKLALGSVVVRVITHKGAGQLVEGLRLAGYGVTCIEGEGAKGAVEVILTVLPRRELDAVVEMLKRFDPNVFYSVDALQSATAGVAPQQRRPSLLPGLASFW